MKNLLFAFVLSLIVGCGTENDPAPASHDPTTPQHVPSCPSLSSVSGFAVKYGSDGTSDSCVGYFSLAPNKISIVYGVSENGSTASNGKLTLNSNGLSCWVLYSLYEIRTISSGGVCNCSGMTAVNAAICEMACGRSSSSSKTCSRTSSWLLTVPSI